MMFGTGRGIIALRRGNNQKSARATGRREAESMIDQSTTARREVAVQESEDTALDEARLRQQAIGVKLRQMFDQVVNEPVPEEFLEILRRADQRSVARKV
jgi:hypothetical protein